MGVGVGVAEALGVASGAEDFVTAETAFATPHTISAMITSNPSPVTIRLTHREGGTCPPAGFLGEVPPELWDERLDALHEEPSKEMKRPKKTVVYWA